MADTVVTELPEYVDFGFRSSYPGPFFCRKADMQMLVLQGDGKRIEKLVQRTLTEPAGGAVEYRPLGDRVILLYGFNQVTSATPPWDGRGAVAETLASFWVPLWAGHTRDGRFHAERLCMSVPFLLVDNPMSLVGGREIYGFAKALGRFGYEGERLLIEGYGGDWRSDQTARWRDLIEIEPAEDTVAGEEAEELGGVPELVDALGHELIDDFSGENLDLSGGVRLGEELCRSLRSGMSHQVFLKQFRDIGDQSRACYRAVVEAPVRTLHVRPRRPLCEWEVTIHPLDSHPITAELGLESQRSRWSVHLSEYDFDELKGHVVGPPAQVT